MEADRFNSRSSIPGVRREADRARSQLDRLNALWSALVPANAFYSQKLKGTKAPAKFASLEEFTRAFPFTTKQEIVEDQRVHPPYGTNLNFPLNRYTRLHATSGTTGAPVRWLDTPESWSAMVDCWVEVFRAAGVAAADRALFAFSFGPFLGFWLAYEAAQRIGCLCIPGGGLNSVARLRMLIENEVTILCCTPTYAARLAEVADTEGIDLRKAKVKTIVVAGEPGGSLPATRRRLETLWNGARLFDHHGMTEVGPVTYECPGRPGLLHVMEDAFLPEIVDPATGRAVPPGARGELVLTTLLRAGSPLLRYRTGDLVRAATAPVCFCGRTELGLDGGILGRTDDMVIVRGVNIFPSAIEDVILSSGDVAEYRVEVTETNSLVELQVQVEPRPACAEGAALVQHLESAFQNSFSLRIPVRLVSPGSLPRFEMKANRWVRS